MQNFSEYPLIINVGFSTVIIENLEKRIGFCQSNPELAYKVAISKIDCERQGIDHRLFFGLEPLTEIEQRRNLETLASNPEYRAAFVQILTSGGGQGG